MCLAHPRLLQNRLSGSLPAGWELPPSLTALSLQNNRFSGTLSPATLLPAGLQSLAL